MGWFAEYFNHRRVHESLDNLTLADVYLGGDNRILAARQLVKEQTLCRRMRGIKGFRPLNRRC